MPGAWPPSPATSRRTASSLSTPGSVVSTQASTWDLAEYAEGPPSTGAAPHVTNYIYNGDYHFHPTINVNVAHNRTSARGSDSQNEPRLHQSAGVRGLYEETTPLRHRKQPERSSSTRDLLKRTLTKALLLKSGKVPLNDGQEHDELEQPSLSRRMQSRAVSPRRSPHEEEDVSSDRVFESFQSAPKFLRKKHPAVNDELDKHHLLSRSPSSVSRASIQSKHSRGRGSTRNPDAESIAGSEIRHSRAHTAVENPFAEPIMHSDSHSLPRTPSPMDGHQRRRRHRRRRRHASDSPIRESSRGNMPEPEDPFLDSGFCDESGLRGLETPSTPCPPRRPVASRTNSSLRGEIFPTPPSSQGPPRRFKMHGRFEATVSEANTPQPQGDVVSIDSMAVEMASPDRIAHETGYFRPHPPLNPDLNLVPPGEHLGNRYDTQPMRDLGRHGGQGNVPLRATELPQFGMAANDRGERDSLADHTPETRAKKLEKRNQKKLRRME